MSETQTVTLAEFLLARFDEDEADAREAGSGSSGRWTFSNSGIHHAEREDWPVVDYINDDGPHIARHDPARVMAECAAKRRIVEEGRSECGARGDKDNAELVAHFAERGMEVRLHWPDAYESFCDGCAAAQSADAGHERVLELLALPYADHPDYRQEWKP